MTQQSKRSTGPWLVFGLSAVLSAMALAISLAQPALGQGNQETDPNPAPALEAERPALADLIEDARPSVVNISVEKAARNPQRLDFRGGPGMDEFFERFFGHRSPGLPTPQDGRRMRGAGSGFVIDADGYIVTNNHVIDGADTITVTFQDGERYEAELLGTDPKTDLALLKIDAADLPAARFGDSDNARVGDWVVAIGNPFGLGGTATAGIISARGRDLRSGPYDDFLQIDAPINQGNSGGPVFNTAGEVIGVNTAIYSPNGGNVGIGFAIPANQAEDIVAELRDSGTVERGWLGVQLQAVDEPLAESLELDRAAGALVAEVVSGSPAEDAGVEVGDVILAFDDEEIDTPKDLSRIVGSAEIGERADMRIWRGGQLERLTVKLGRADSPIVAGGGESQAEVGLALAPLDERARAQLGLDDDATGAVVARVQPSSSAAQQGLRPGDLIVSVDQRAVDSPKDVSRAITRARNGGQDKVLLLVRRGDSQRFAALQLG